jgi:uncharacterized repeat protein (TIGR04076 family)
MYELKITARKVLGVCTSDPPVQPGDYFTVSNGNIRVPAGGSICIWSLQSMLPLITPKEREIAEAQDADWLWRVHHAQCPDPDGRVIYKIERVGQVQSAAAEPAEDTLESANQVLPPGASSAAPLQDVRLVVEEVRGKCTSPMRPGDTLILRRGRLYLPGGRHFCLYALQAALPFLPAKQRALADSDWMKGELRIICPDPAGNVVMRIEPYAGW